MAGVSTAKCGPETLTVREEPPDERGQRMWASRDDTLHGDIESAQWWAERHARERAKAMLEALKRQRKETPP